MKKLGLFIVMILALSSCMHTGDSSDNTKIAQKEKVLIVIVENNDLSSRFLEELYSNVLTRPLILNVLSETLGVDTKKLSQYSLNGILDKFGEKKVLHSVAQSGKNKYDQIILLNDEKASLENFLKVINSFNSLEHRVDLIIDLHANNDVLAFYNKEIVRIERLISEINDPKKIRCVYQTCCYGASMMEEWIEAGVQAVNGASGENPFVFYSASLFLEAWIEGATFEDAVQEARSQEQVLFENFIQKHLFKNAVPLILSASVIDGGEMSIAGNRELLWSQ